MQISPSPQPHYGLFKDWKQSDHGFGNGVYAWSQQRELLLPNVVLTNTITKSLMFSPQYGTTSHRDKLATWRKDGYIGPPPSRKGQRFSLKGTYRRYGCALPAHNALPTSSVD
jgi:hypothetical protein